MHLIVLNRHSVVIGKRFLVLIAISALCLVNDIDAEFSCSRISSRPSRDKIVSSLQIQLKSTIRRSSKVVVFSDQISVRVIKHANRYQSRCWSQ